MKLNNKMFKSTLSDYKHLKRNLRTNPGNTIDKSKTGKIVKKKDIKNHIPRPANSFICFLSNYKTKLIKENPKIKHSNISVIAGKVWHALSANDKEPYIEMARKIANQHKEKYPDYTYSPRKKKQRSKCEKTKYKEIINKSKCSGVNKKDVKTGRLELNHKAPEVDYFLPRVSNQSNADEKIINLNCNEELSDADNYFNDNISDDFMVLLSQDFKQQTDDILPDFEKISPDQAQRDKLLDIVSKL